MTGIRARIPEYAGLADPTACHVSDAHLRAWVGERLVDIREKMAADEGLRDRLDDAILRCELGDPHLIAAFEEHGAVDRPEGRTRLAAADAALVAAVDEAEAAADAAALGRAIDAVHAALDARNAVAAGDAP